MPLPRSQWQLSTRWHRGKGRLAIMFLAVVLLAVHLTGCGYQQGEMIARDVEAHRAVPHVPSNQQFVPQQAAVHHDANLAIPTVGQAAPTSDEPEFHTFSICGIDPLAEQCGVAVTTRVTMVGRYVPWVRAGVGAVATQATTAVQYGRQGLDLLAAGKTPSEAIDELLADDDHRESRQLGIIDMQGRTAAFTGQDNGVFAGSRQGKNYTVQGNLLVGRQVIDAVAERFEETEGAGLQLADRLISALEAGQEAGGDKRKGREQSAALLVAGANHRGVDSDHIVDTLQVAEHPEPVGELRRQYDTIHGRLGYRTFSLVRGGDVVELKRMLHALKLLWPEMAEFPNRVEKPDLVEFNPETAAAVDRFRALHGLPVPTDGLGHSAGLVDAPFVAKLRASYQEQFKKAPDQQTSAPAEKPLPEKKVAP
jgi:uncharacterized Ntn-hydrolase superfamily protein